MKYRVIHNYRTPALSLEAGAIIDLDDETAAFLLTDSPGVIVPDAPARDVQAPQANRQVTAPTGRRSRLASEG